MDIIADNLGKRYLRDWIFRGFSYRFEQGNTYAILGANGSGKSTLLKVLSGHLTPAKGTLLFSNSGTLLSRESVFQDISYAAPYIELIEELTLEEAVGFHINLKPLSPGFDTDKIIEMLGFSKARHKEIRYFSSGMKQRLKLILALASNSSVVLLDEPSTNLDVQGIDWYKKLVQDLTGDKLVIIASNDPHDLELCKSQINIMDYKK
jgi:ABC-type multidrug transport system ATPase subunit